MKVHPSRNSAVHVGTLAHPLTSGSSAWSPLPTPSWLLMLSRQGNGRLGLRLSAWRSFWKDGSVLMRLEKHLRVLK